MALSPRSLCRGGGVSKPRKRSETVEAATDGAAPEGRLPLWSRPGYLVRRLHQIHTALFAEECKAFAITPVQYGVLTALLYYPGSDQVSLGAEIGIDRSNVADVLERLTERGLVRREKSAADRRMMLAFLTADGEALTREMHGAMQVAQERFLAPLAPADRRSFMAMLVTLIDGNNQYGRSLLREDAGARGKRSA
ncbi:MAG: winged helix-turn-helix transcriptional regulator [Alphaproteobacteria bacterium]|nr:winged helix-turn-helix transcriptional regulator [Alphaproteobacteria bacterium]